MTAFLIVQGASFVVMGNILRIGSQSMYLKRAKQVCLQMRWQNPFQWTLYYISATGEYRHERNPLGNSPAYLLRALFRMRYLALPLGMLETEFDRDIDKIGTDGQRLVFNPDWLEERFIGSDDEPPILILHQLYHCLLLHPFINRGEDTTQWHLACDLVVWYLVDKTYPETLPPEYASLCAEACAFCDKYMDVPTSDGIYRLLQSQEVEIEASRFMQDDHSLWPTAQKKAGKLPPKKYSGPGEGGSGEERVVKQWKHISDRVASLNPHMKKPGKGTRSLRKAISLSAAKRIGYTDFLKRFSVFER